MEINDLDRYTLSKIDEQTFTLTDTCTLESWQIKILTNTCDNNKTEQSNEATDSHP